MTTEYVSFKIDGEWLCDLCRTLVVEGKWEKALKILMEDVSCGYEQATTILKGHANLVNVEDSSELEWKDLPHDGPIARKVQENMDWFFGTLFRYKDVYWRPYATVTGLSRVDYEFCHTCSNSNILPYVGDGVMGNTYKRSLARRPFFYADSPETDMLVVIKGKAILCKIVANPPLWVKVSQDPQEHLKELDAANKLSYLESRGADTSLRDRVEKATTVPASTSEKLSKILPDYDEQAEEYRQELRNKVLDDYRSKIIAQANERGGWLTLQLDDGDGYVPATWSVPKNPFIRWALRLFDFEKFNKTRPEWVNVCPSGMKLSMDDPNHTDWMLGAGLDIGKTYDRFGEDENCLERRVMKAAFEYAFKINEEYSQSDFTVLAGKFDDDRTIYAKVVHAKPNRPVPNGCIAIAPHAGPEYQLAMQSANRKNEFGSRGVIICATGGKLAHLAVVGKEMDCTVLMIPDAINKFDEDKLVTIDMKERTIHF